MGNMNNLTLQQRSNAKSSIARLMDLDDLWRCLQHKLLNKVGRILHCCDVLCTCFVDSYVECLLEAHHNLNLQEKVGDVRVLLFFLGSYSQFRYIGITVSSESAPSSANFDSPVIAVPSGRASCCFTILQTLSTVSFLA